MVSASPVKVDQDIVDRLVSRAEDVEEGNLLIEAASTIQELRATVGQKELEIKRIVRKGR